MSGRVGNYVSVRPLQLGNYVSAESRTAWVADTRSGARRGYLRQPNAPVPTSPTRTPPTAELTSGTWLGPLRVVQDMEHVQRAHSRYPARTCPRSANEVDEGLKVGSESHVIDAHGITSGQRTDRQRQIWFVRHRRAINQYWNDAVPSLEGGFDLSAHEIVVQV